MKMRHAYLGLCVLGFLLPYSQLIPWFAAHGLNLPLFFKDLFATRVSAFFGMDVIVSAMVLFLFIWLEGRRLAMRHLYTCASGSLISYLPDPRSRGHTRLDRFDLRYHDAPGEA